MVWSKAEAREYRKRHYEAHRAEYLERAKRWSREARVRVAEFLDEYKHNHPCADCGETDPVVLEFHHVAEKSENIADMVRRQFSIAKISAELEKCITLCANCHRRRHARERAEDGWTAPQKHGDERQPGLFDE